MLYSSLSGWQGSGIRQGTMDASLRGITRQRAASRAQQIAVSAAHYWDRHCASRRSRHLLLAHLTPGVGRPDKSTQSQSSGRSRQPPEGSGAATRDGMARCAGSWRRTRASADEDTDGHLIPRSAGNTRHPPGRRASGRVVRRHRVGGGGDCGGSRKREQLHQVFPRLVGARAITSTPAGLRGLGNAK